MGARVRSGAALAPPSTNAAAMKARLHATAASPWRPVTRHPDLMISKSPRRKKIEQITTATCEDYRNAHLLRERRGLS